MQKNGKIEAVSFDCLEHHCLEQLKSLIKIHNLPYLADSKWDYAYTGPSDHPILLNVDSGQLARNRMSIDQLEEVAKLVLFTDDNQILEKLNQLPVQTYMHTGEQLIDISPRDINKWSGLQKLDVVDGQFIAFGNDLNDIEMFSHAKYSVCIGSHPVASNYAMKCIPPLEICSEIQSIVDDGASPNTAE